MKKSDADFTESSGPYDIMIDKQIVALAHHYWEQRGSPTGSPGVDWASAVDAVNRDRAWRGLHRI